MMSIISVQNLFVYETVNYYNNSLNFGHIISHYYAILVLHKCKAYPSTDLADLVEGNHRQQLQIYFSKF